MHVSVSKAGYPVQKRIKRQVTPHKKRHVRKHVLFHHIWLIAYPSCRQDMVEKVFYIFNSGKQAKKLLSLGFSITDRDKLLSSYMQSSGQYMTFTFPVTPLLLPRGRNQTRKCSAWSKANMNTLSALRINTSLHPYYKLLNL